MRWKLWGKRRAHRPFCVVQRLPVLLFWHAMIGEAVEGIARLHAALESEGNISSTFTTRIMIAIGGSHWMLADTVAALRIAQQRVEVAQARHLIASQGWLYMLLSFLHYQRNDLAAAASCCRALVEHPAGVPRWRSAIRTWLWHSSGRQRQRATHNRGLRRPTRWHSKPASPRCCGHGRSHCAGYGGRRSDYHARRRLWRLGALCCGRQAARTVTTLPACIASMWRASGRSSRQTPGTDGVCL